MSLFIFKSLQVGRWGPSGPPVPIRGYMNIGMLLIFMLMLNVERLCFPGRLSAAWFDRISWWWILVRTVRAST